MENKLITNYLINKKIIMKKFCIYIVFLCFQQLCAEGHVSILQRIISSDGQDITNNFTSKNKGISVHQDCPMCYVTHGEKACAAEEAKNFNKICNDLKTIGGN